MRCAVVLVVSLGIAMIVGAATAEPARNGSALAPVRLTFRAGSSICIARADGTQRRRFVRVRPRWAISRASWSPRGKFAALIRGADLVRFDQKGHLDRDVLPGFSYPPEDGAVWSPDGRWLAVAGGGHGGSIGVVPAVGGGGWDNWRLLWATESLSEGLDSPTWTADSHHLAFAATLHDPQWPYWDTSIYTIGLDGSGFRRLVRDAGMPAYSPDGRQLAYVHAGGIWVSDADGTNPRRVTEGTDDARPAWSPRSRLIAFERTVDRRTSIHAVKPDGSDEHVLVSSPRYNATMPSWRPPAPFDGGRRRPCP